MWASGETGEPKKFSSGAWLLRASEVAARLSFTCKFFRFFPLSALSSGVPKARAPPGA
jgi:hypothetical protein